MYITFSCSYMRSYISDNLDSGTDAPEGVKPAFYVMNATIPKNIPNGVGN